MDKEKIIKVLSTINDYRYLDRVNEMSVFNEEYFGFTKSEYNGVIEYLLNNILVTGFFRVPIMGQSFKTYNPDNR